MRSTRLSDRPIVARGVSGQTRSVVRRLSQFVPHQLLLIASVILFVTVGVGPNYILVIASILAFLLGVSWLWRPGETPILLYLFFFQWLQVSLPVFHANWLGLSLHEYSLLHGNIHLAFFISLIGLVIVALGIRLGAKRQSFSVVEISSYQGHVISIKRIFWLYLFSFVIATYTESIEGSFGGLRQILLAFLSIRWALYFVLAYVSFIQKKVMLHYLGFAFLLEFLISIGGFFSDFKTVFLFTLFAIFATRVKVSAKQLVVLTALGAFLLFLGVIWSSVKIEYRDYVSGGTGQQVVQAGSVERINKLTDMVSALDTGGLSDGFERLLRRTGYIEFFGRVIDVVPGHLSHTNGSIWWDALTRPLMPRLLFPDKASINDTQRTTAYTGVLFQGATSVSLGYMAEAYIDFGIYGMMLLLLAYGYVLGRLYKWLIEGRYTHGLLGMGIASSVLFVATAFESSATKVIGGVAVSVLVTWSFARWYVPKFSPWLRARKNSKGY